MVLLHCSLMKRFVFVVIIVIVITLVWDFNMLNNFINPCRTPQLCRSLWKGCYWGSICVTCRTGKWEQRLKEKGGGRCHKIRKEDFS